MEKVRKVDTSKLLTMIRRSGDFSEVDKCLEEIPDSQGLGEYLYQLMEKYKMQPKDVIQLSGIERSYFYHILSGQKSPGRNILLRVCFCLSANLDETNQALRYASHGALYPKVRRDALIIYAITHKYDMRQVNAKLIEQGELPLFQEGRMNES